LMINKGKLKKSDEACSSASSSVMNITSLVYKPRPPCEKLASSHLSYGVVWKNKSKMNL
jgi:hypothetical protein